MSMCIMWTYKYCGVCEGKWFCKEATSKSSYSTEKFKSPLPLSTSSSQLPTWPTSLVVRCSSSYSCSCSWSCCWIVWSLTKSLSLSLKTLNYHSRRFFCDSTCSIVHCSDLITSRSYSCFCSTTFCNCFAWISMVLFVRKDGFKLEEGWIV